MESLIVFLKNGESIRYPEKSEAEWDYGHGVVRVETPLSDIKDIYRMEEIQSVRYSGNVWKDAPAKKEAEEREPCLHLEIYRGGRPKKDVYVEGIAKFWIECGENGKKRLVIMDSWEQKDIEDMPIDEVSEIYAAIEYRKKAKA